MPPTPEVVVTAPSGDVEPFVEPLLVDETYDRGRFRGRAFAGLAPVVSGTYRITTSMPDGGADDGRGWPSVSRPSVRRPSSASP